MHYIFITYNYKLCYQEMVKNMLLHMEFDIEYINILEKLSKDNFPYKTIKKNEENLIFYFENLYLGMGRKFLNNFTLTENLFFNGNMIFNYKDIENIFDINHLEITTIQRIKLKIQILNDLSYEGFLNDEKFFYLDNHNERHIILYKRLLDELYPIVSKPILESKKFWCNKKYMVEIFLDKISGFLESFITNIINLDYGTHSSNIILTIYNFYSKYEWIEKYLPNLVKQSINPEIKIEFITISEYPEITDINLEYLKQGQLNAEILGRGYSWLDTGTHESLLEASAFISTIQKRQGFMVACPEEVSFYNNWINEDDLNVLAKSLNNDYGQYLLTLKES